MKQSKRPLIDFDDHLQNATDDIGHHIANSETYLRVLCTIKLREIGYYDEDDMHENLNAIFDNRAKHLKQNAKDKQNRAKVSLDKRQITMWLLDKLTTFVVFLCSLLAARYLS